MAGKSPLSHQTSSGKTAPTLTPTGKFAGKPQVPLSRTITLIGSGAGARLQLISSSVSKAHALLVNCENGVYVRDLASRTKVLVNGAEVREAVLNQGDTVQFGKFAFTFNQPPGGEEPRLDAEKVRRLAYASMLTELAAANRCEEAMALLAEVGNGSVRKQAVVAIAGALARSGRMTALEQWVNSLPSPMERAEAAIEVVLALSPAAAVAIPSTQPTTRPVVQPAPVQPATQPTTVPVAITPIS